MDKLRQKIMVLMMVLMTALPSYGESFAHFLVNFLYFPAKQSTMVRYPLRIDRNTIGSSRNYKPYFYAPHNQIALLCADSLSGASAGAGEKKISFVSLQQKSGISYSFGRTGRRWLLHAGQSVTAGKSADNEFLNFLTEYSRNRDFQMKHTIFPFPQRYIKGGRESSKLLMPREWPYLSFAGICPQLGVFENSGNATNRRLYIYHGTRLSQIYNFIRINRNWFLIEVENY